MNSLPNARIPCSSTLRLRHSRLRSGISPMATSYMTALFPHVMRKPDADGGVRGLPAVPGQLAPGERRADLVGKGDSH